MSYFKVLGLFFGVAAMLKPFYMHILPWDENTFIKKAYSEKRPKWIIPIAIFGLFLVGFTWFMELITEIPYSIIITVLFSLTAIKAMVLVFNYNRFHKWVAGMLAKDKGKRIVLIDVLVGLFGLAVVIATLKLY